MGVEAGINIHPLLESAEDLAAWERFLVALRERFKRDPCFHEKDGIICFEAGEWPALFWDGRYIRRFVSKVGLISVERDADPIIETVTALMRRYLPPDRVHDWLEDYGPYSVDFEEPYRAEDAWVKKYRPPGPDCPRTRVLGGRYAS
jgi:hypothetical protein